MLLGNRLTCQQKYHVVLLRALFFDEIRDTLENKSIALKEELWC